MPFDLIPRRASGVERLPLRQSRPKLAAMLSAGGKTNEIAERLYLTILSRFPTDADVKAVEEYAKAGGTKGREMWIDLAWALINSPEFLLRH